MQLAGRLVVLRARLDLVPQLQPCPSIRHHSTRHQSRPPLTSAGPEKFSPTIHTNLITAADPIPRRNQNTSSPTMPPHPTHDATPNTICLCPTCIDDIALFATSLTTLPQARAVTSHLIAQHQDQLCQISALTSMLEEKDPLIELLRQQVDALREQLRGYEGGVDGREMATSLSNSMQAGVGNHHHQRSTSSLTSTSSSSSSTTSVAEEERENETLTHLSHLRQQRRSERKREHPAAMRLRAACNEYANQAHAREVEAQEEAADWVWYAEGLRERVGDLVGVEQWAIDCQIYREMGECEMMFE